MIVRRHPCVIVLLATCCIAGAASAGIRPDAGLAIGTTPTIEVGVARVDTGRNAAYRDVLTDFDASMQATPDAPAPAIEKCRFIARFTDTEYNFVPQAEVDLAACTRYINARWPKDTDVRLFRLDQLWGEDAISTGEAWLDESRAWPPEARRHLLTKLSEAYGGDDASGRGDDYAVQAARLGDTTHLADAIDRLVKTGHAGEAQALLRAAPAATLSWQASRRVTAALALPDRSSALKELRRYDGTDVEVDANAAAQAYLRAGDSVAARKRLSTETRTTPDLRETRFKIAIANADMATAAGLIDAWSSKDFAIAIQRFAVVAGRAPAMLLTRSMGLAGLFLLLVLGVMALAPGLVLLPVHYRGLFRRSRGKPATPVFPRIGLRQAWLGAAVAICVPLMVGIVAIPDSVATLLGGKGLPPKADLLRLALWGSLAGLVLLVPVARRLGMRQVIGDRAVWANNWWRILVAWAVLIIVSMLIARINSHAGDTSTLQTKAVDALVAGGREQFGVGLTLLLVAVLVPVYEELVFRGLLLGGMTAHIGFGWANVIQAVLFATLHGDTPRFVFYLALGLLSGWLVKKSKSLGPGMALHGANNALATLVRIAAVAT